MVHRLLLLVAGWFALLQPLPIAAAPTRLDSIEVELLSEVTSVRPGEPFWLGLRLKPDPHWKSYWRNPGGAGLPTKVRWQLPDGFEAGPLQWPFPDRFTVQGIVNYGYDGEVLLLSRVAVADDVLPGTPVEIGAQAQWLACNDVCIPGRAGLKLALPVSDAPAARDPRNAALFTEARRRLPVTVAPGSSRFAIADGRLRLQVERRALGLPSATRVDFFPYQGRLLDDSVPQRQSMESGWIVLEQTVHALLKEPPSTVDGVLVVSAPGATRAFELVASAGPVSRQVALLAAGPGSAAVAVTGSLVPVLALALLGGLALNLMPCVFPVLMLKAINLLESVKVGGRTQRLHGVAYSAGVVLFFVLVAALLQLLKAGGHSVGWGFQLQTPWFVAALAYLLFVLGLGFSGLLEIGGRFMGLGGSLAGRGGHAGSFFTGALAAVVASPCTAPFMGAAIAYAITQPFSISLLVFAALGFGMALPFLAIAFAPRLARLLPRPGAWMDTFKQAMAFPLYLTALWLVWVLGRQTDVTQVALVLSGMLLIVFATWIYRLRVISRRWLRINVGVAALATVTAGVILFTPGLRPATAGVANAGAEAPFWTLYSAARFAELRGAGRPVFLNITADWCISCIANERVALSLPQVRDAFSEAGIVALKGDWTDGDPELTAILESFGRNGVPLYVLYPSAPERTPVMLPQWLTPMNVLAVIHEFEPVAASDPVPRATAAEADFRPG